MENIVENIVYVSGSHGSGKSTLIRDLSKDRRIYAYGRAYELDIEGVYNSALWKLTKYYIERSHHQELSKDLSGVAILSDRCSYDNLAYTSAFVRLGMMTKEQKMHHDSVFEAMFPDSMRAKNIIYLAPGLDWIKERIEERWKITGKGWKEDDYGYLAAVVEEYDKFYDGLKGVNVLKIIETDRHKREELARAWIEKESDWGIGMNIEEIHEKAHYISITGIVHNDGKYLICQRSLKEKIFPGKWCVPGGRLMQSDFLGTKKDTNDHWLNIIEKTCAKEILEECNIHIKNIGYVSSLVLIRPNGFSTVIVSMQAEYNSGDVKMMLPDELSDYAWVTLEEAKGYDLIENIYEQLEKVEGMLRH